MDLIPYVFEFARIRNNKENDTRFVMRYEEYTDYRKMFEDLSDQEKRMIYEKVMKRKKNVNMWSGNKNTKTIVLQLCKWKTLVVYVYVKCLLSSHLR